MHALSRLVALGVVAASGATVQAQVARVHPSASSAPSASARAATAAPNPAGLRPVFPAGITSGSGAAVSTDPVAANAAGSTGITPPGSPVTGSTTVPAELLPVDGTLVVPATNVVGGAGSSVRGPGQRPAGGAGGFSATDQARSFYFADANHDGELTRAEAARLSISTMSFEEMDRNFDGIISRFEYEDSLR
ncbi:MAG: hypothetical protein JWP41_2530 [Ramlibacter sp.]|nr:hypothetical protein [Ramlibacter sp.]